MISETITIPSDSTGTQHTLSFFRFGRAGARPCLYIQARLHADEIPGMALRGGAAASAGDHRIPRRNPGRDHPRASGEPLGPSQHLLGQEIGRFDLSDGGNFNRGYPAFGGRPCVTVWWGG